MGENKIIAIRPESIIEARYSLTTRQNNIIDMLLSEISEDDNLSYTFDVDKYRHLIEGDTSNIYRDLKKAVKGFEGNKGLNLKDGNTGEEIWFAWFSKIHYKPKYGKIEVNIDKDLKSILYEAKKRIYYDLKYTLNFKSFYSQRYYYYAKSFEDTGWRLDRIEDLIYKLECPNSYKNFANLKKNVLDKAYEEINKTDISIEFQPIKTGKKVTHMKTLIKPKNKNIIYCKELSVEYIISTIGGLINGEVDAKKILKILSEVDLVKFKYDSLLNYYNAKVDYIIKYHTNHKELPFIGCIINGIRDNWSPRKQEQFNLNENIKTRIKPKGFHNFEGRNYTDEEYEKMQNKLLGWE